MQPSNNQPVRLNTAQKQQQEALKTDKISRDIRFRIIGRPESEVVELVCANCSHTFGVRLIAANYFFTCGGCRTIGNLPGVLAAEIDRAHSALDQVDEKKEKLAELKQKFPPPPAVAPPPPQVRKQTT